MPVTTPEVTVAFALLLVQAPPLTPLVSVILDPTQTLEAPVILPALGSGLTVTIRVVVPAPKLPVAA